MKNLICHTSNCEHNVKANCLAGVVTVSDKAKCLSKLRREGGALAQAFADVEAAEDLDLVKPSDSVVQCNADCIYNSSNICACDHIVVDDGLLGTKCRTRETVK